MHHIITDGTSQAILEREFMSLYRGEPLVPLRLQYKDFSRWQKWEEQQKPLKQQEQYWLSVFSGELPVLNLPTDSPRPLIQSFEGNTVNFVINEQQTHALRDMARQADATLYMSILGVYTILLYKFSGQEDIVVGTPIAARRHADLESIMGMFANTLALRNYPCDEKTFHHYLKEVKERTLAAFENQEYPFEEMVDRVAVNRDTGRNPLFDVMFVFQNFEYDNPSGDVLAREGSAREMPGPQQQPVIDYKNNTAKFDLTVYVTEVGKGLALSLEYSTKLFKKETIEGFIKYFKKIVTVIVNEPGITLGQIEIISKEQTGQILYDFNRTAAEYPGDKTIQQLFADQALRTPDHIALVGPAPGAGTPAVTPLNTANITYKGLDEKTDELARLLREKGVQPCGIVGIMLERSPGMIAAIFSILKAGGAYLPIDPAYPKERIEFILEDSGAILLLTQKAFLNRVEKKCEILDIEKEIVIKQGNNYPKTVNTPGDLVYVIYTSGSTGKPKGVMIEHRSLVNRLNWMRKCYPLECRDVILQKTAYVFDVSLWELFWWSIQGSSLCLLNPGGEKNPEEIVQSIEINTVTTIHFVPSMLNSFLDYIDASADIKRLAALRRVFASGEALPPHLVGKFNELLNKNNKTRLINLYGPTEATVDVSYYNCLPWGKTIKRIPIGKPIDNIRLYVLDRRHHLQPIGIPGELVISGAGLARGYLNNPELTNEKFLFFSYGSYKFQKIYKTGDLARWLENGNIEYLGG